jgi:hypothetical protein
MLRPSGERGAARRKGFRYGPPRLTGVKLSAQRWPAADQNSFGTLSAKEAASPPGHCSFGGERGGGCNEE